MCEGVVKSWLDAELKEIQQKIREAERGGDDSVIARLSMEQLDVRRKIETLY